MAVYFLETSALVKRYVLEIGTAWVQALAAPVARNRIYVAQITGVEMVAAITLRARRGDLSSQDASAAISDFRQDFAWRYRVARISDVLIAEAMNLAEKHGLRGYDAVQLAAVLRVTAERSAQNLPPLTFLPADAALNAAAVAERLTVDDSNAHP